jgi:hypothetical protein
MNEISVDTAPTTRVIVTRWDAPSGRTLVSITPEYKDRQGKWRLAHSGVSIPPAEAEAVAGALRTIAAAIQGETNP